MNVFLNKKINHRIKNWLSPVKYAEMRSKNAVRNSYTNLYAYAANNPVHYIDPDGRLILNIIDDKLDKAITYLYRHSPTFKEQFNKLLSDKNDIGQKCIVIFRTDDEKYAGNTVSNDSKILYDIKAFGLDEKGNIKIVTEPKTDDNIQAILININLTRIKANGLNLYEVLSEEVCHAADCMSYGAEAWNKKCQNEDKKYSYDDRPREKYAKELVKKILQELENEK